MSNVHLMQPAPVPNPQRGESIPEIGSKCTPGIHLKFDNEEVPFYLKEKCKNLWKNVYENSDLRQRLQITTIGKKNVVRDVKTKPTTKTPRVNNTKDTQRDKQDMRTELDQTQQRFVNDKLNISMRKLEMQEKQLAAGQPILNHILLTQKKEKSVQERLEALDMTWTHSQCMKEIDMEHKLKLDKYFTDDPDYVYKSINEFERRLERDEQKKKEMAKKPQS